MEAAQQKVVEKGIYGEDATAVKNAIQAFTTAFSIICPAAPTAYGIGVTVVALAGDLYPNEKDILAGLEKNGGDFLIQMQGWLSNRPQYDMIEIQYPYLEYYNVDGSKAMHFCTGYGLITRVHQKNGGWVDQA